MGETKIEWTDTTWNPIRGCSRVSTECVNCYAEGIARRFSGPGQPFHLFAERGKPSAWTGKVELIEEKLLEPLSWRKPRKVFVNSMSDLFHENLPDEAIDRVFMVMRRAHWHTFQVLTKRAARMREYMNHSILRLGMTEPPNVWLGVSAGTQAAADESIPLLLQTPAAVRFVSAEPLLEAVDIRRYLGGRIDPTLPVEVIAEAWGRKGLGWVIAGGESGPGARPMHPDWARSLRDQCVAAGVRFLFKQWGGWAPIARTDGFHDSPFGYHINASPDGPHLGFAKVGKAKAGRLLDGREWNEFPEVPHG